MQQGLTRIVDQSLWQSETEDLASAHEPVGAVRTGYPARTADLIDQCPLLLCRVDHPGRTPRAI